MLMFSITGGRGTILSGQGVPCEKVGGAPREIWIKPLKETNLDVARFLFDA